MKILLRNIIFSMFCTLFSLSCTSKQEYSQKYVFDLDALASDTIFYSQIADSITYLDLDSAGTNHIQHYTDMVMSSQDIYILDGEQKCIWNFNYDGSFKRCLNKRGHGPGEYVNLWQFEYDSINQELLVLDSKSVIHYDMDFSFLYKEELDVFATDFKLVRNYYLLSFLGGVSHESGVFLFDRNKKSSRRIISKEENFCWNDGWEMISWGDTIAVSAPPLRNTLFHFKGVIPIDTIEIITPRSNRTYQIADNPFQFDDYSRTIFMESTEWLFMVFWKHDTIMQNVVLNKNTGQLIKGSVLYNDVDLVDWSYGMSYSEGNAFSFIVEKDNSGGMAIQFLHLK